MLLFSNLKSTLQKTKAHILESTLDNIVWTVNNMPKFAGFSIRGKEMFLPFWIMHLSLLFYVYGVGNLMYQLKIASGVEDFIKSYVNVSLLILVLNFSWWWLSKRPLLLETLALVEESDRNARSMESLRVKHAKLLMRIKLIICIFYFCNCLDSLLIYLPHRVNVHNDYCMIPCVGLEPLTSSPNREICLTILLMQELSIMVVSLNYQTLMLFLIAHTSAMYQMLSQELTTFDEFSNSTADKALVKEKLPLIIQRHVMILSTFDKLKALYSMPLGVDFGSNAVCIALFFYLPVLEWLKYSPIVIYCVLSFFLYCFLCQKLLNASEVYERAVYSCGWENFDVKEKKLVYVMLRQAQKPVILLAADIIPVNMYTFATTLQGLFKFITVVKL